MGVGVAVGDGAEVAVDMGVGVGVCVDVGAGVGVVAVIGEGVAVVADGVSTAAGVAVGGRSSSQAESAATATEHSNATKMREQIVIPPIQTAFVSVPIQGTELPQSGCTIFRAPRRGRRPERQNHSIRMCRQPVNRRPRSGDARQEADLCYREGK